VQRKIKYKDQDQDIEATVVSFDVKEEPWSSYHLSDGSTIRLKTVVTEVLRAEGVHSDNGDPLYVVNTKHMVTLLNTPDHLRKEVSQNE